MTLKGKEGARKWGLWLAILVSLYGVYLLALGLPIVTKSPAERAKRYTAVVAIFAAALIVLTAFAQNALFSRPGA